MKLRSIADPIFGDIPLTTIEAKVLNTREFNRLHNLRQVSTAYFTYPSLKVSRFEHSLGVMHLAGEVTRNAFHNADEEI